MITKSVRILFILCVIQQSFADNTPATHSRLSQKLKKIVSRINQAIAPIKDSAANKDKPIHFSQAAEDFNTIIAKILKTTDTAERLLSQNEHAITDGLGNVQSILQNIKSKAPELTRQVTQISQQLNTRLLPQVEHDLEHMSASIDTLVGSFESIANTINNGVLPHIEKELPQVMSSLDHLAVHVTKEFLPKVEKHADTITQAVQDVKPITQKIVAGKSFIGQMVNDETDTYNNFRHNMHDIHQLFRHLDKLTFAFDAHLEFLYGFASCCKKYKDFKQYANILIFIPDPKCFLLIGGTYSQWGYAKRNAFEVMPLRFCNPDNSTCFTLGAQQNGSSSLICTKKLKKNSATLNLQAGAVCGNFAARIGVFEGRLGAALDYCLFYKRIGLVSTLEIFDFNGSNRIFCDKRPHLKWLNRLFIGCSAYLDFGLDDFAARYSKAGFIGFGAYFSESDLRWFTNWCSKSVLQ